MEQIASFLIYQQYHLQALEFNSFFHGHEFVALNSRHVVKWLIDALALSDHCN